MENKRKIEIIQNNKKMLIERDLGTRDATVTGQTGDGSLNNKGLKIKYTDSMGKVVETPIINVPDDTIIETNPCTWYFCGGRYWYICS